MASLYLSPITNLRVTPAQCPFRNTLSLGFPSELDMKDVDESQSSDPLDPLHSFSGLCLFPRTFGDSMNPPKPNHPDDLESIHGFMKSMALRSHRKYSEQAKAIVDGNSELLNSNFASFLSSENKNETVAAKGKENAQDRRPALGRRRAQFFLKPIVSQPSVIVEPSLDIDQLQDPEEYFLAHEKLENAKKELQRQRGGSITDLDNYKLSKTERRRRPGILGKSVSYKHRYSSVLPESDNTFMSSQETLGQDILSPPNYISQPETADTNVELQEQELTGSIHKTEKSLNGLLDVLLSDNCGNLDEDGTLSFLQDRLQIKPLDLDKLCLPEFNDVGKIDFMELGGNLRKPRKALSDIQNLGKGISGKTPVKHKQVAESPFHSLASPTPPRSPFASVSLLIKHISKSNMLSNPFSARDLSAARNYSSVEHVDEQSSQHNSVKELGISGELKSLITEINDVRVDDVGAQEMITGDSILPFEKSVNDNSSRLSVGINVTSSGSQGDLKDNNGSWNLNERIMDDNDNRLNTDKDVRENGPNEMEENDTMLNTVTDIQANGPNELEENVGVMPQEAVSYGDVNIGDSSRPYTDFQTDGPNEMEKSDLKDNNGSWNMNERIMDNNNSRLNTDKDVRENGPNEMEENDSMLNTVTDIQANGPNELVENVGDMPQEALSNGDVNVGDSSRPYTDFQSDGPNEMEKSVEDMPQNAEPDTNIEDPTTGNLDCNHSQQGQSSPAVVRPHAMDGPPSETADLIPEQHIENIQEPSRVSLNERSVAKRPGLKRKTLSHRQSLAEAGTFWESGVRRSKRIKMRPLEYWKGERFLYGRIHKSLATVIGVKYVSPVKGDEKPSIRVKSYVSDEYKELVELAALH